MNNKIERAAVRGYCNEISVLKLIFAVILVLYHYYIGLKTEGGFPFYRGYLGVEFFFMVSGYLMMKKIYSSDIGAAEYTIKHAKKLYPQYIAALIMITIYSLIYLAVNSGLELKSVISVALSFIQESLFLQEIKIPFGIRLIGQAWYISAMLIAGFFMFAILKKFRKDIVLAVFTILSIVIMTASYMKYGNFHLNTENISFKGLGIYFGLPRGAVDMTLGCLAYELSENYLKKLSPVKSLAAKFIHLIMLVAVMAIVCCSFVPDYDFIMIFCCFVMVTLTFSRLSFFAELYQKIPIKRVEEFSLVIYLNYLLIRRFLFEVAGIYNIFVYFIACTAYSVLAIAVINYIMAKLYERKCKI